MRLSPAIVLCIPLLIGIACAGQDVKNLPKGEQIPGPSCAAIGEWDSHTSRICSSEDYKEWLADVQHWRRERRIRIGYNSEQYDRPELKWAQSSFVQAQMMIHDRYFYDPVAGHYTVDRYLDDVTNRYGGIDSILIWHSYPNIGIDNRNQYDLFRDLPGGTAGVRQMVEDFHRRGVRVLFPEMVWDQGTHNEGVPDWQAISQELAGVNADGMNGDTLNGVPRAFRIASDATGHPLALEPEGRLDSDEAIAYNNLSWGYWDYEFVPSVSRYKWLETRHMVNLCNRWAHSHLDDLQEAFFNGVGFESWENVWGIWNQMTARDAEALRRIATTERSFKDSLISPAWEPHFQTTYPGVFASKWPGEDRILWTIVNRNHYVVNGVQFAVAANPRMHYFDLWHGVELVPAIKAGEVQLSFELEPDGYGAILATAKVDPALENLLAIMHALSAKPLQSFSSDWAAMPQKLVDIALTEPASVIPPGMVSIPEGDFLFRVHGIEIEGDNFEGVDVQYPWEPSARRFHEHTMHIMAFAMDKYPVTNQEFKQFLNATHYQPQDGHNFLRDWKDGSYPSGWDKKPVTWVSIEDARAYAAWARKRLPHEWEWQYAAQGADGREYPWGGEKDPVRMPTPDKGRDIAPPSDVNLYPAGASPYGVADLVGNVWQWTDEYLDTHTRFAILRGGSHYQPQGSGWYFPQAYELDQHGKYLLMAPSIDRSATVGFRCVKDLR